MRHLFLSFAILGSTLGTAQAERGRQTNHLSRPSLHLALGPTIAGTRLDSGWDSQVGGELHLVHLTPSRHIAIHGAALGVANFSRTRATRLSLDLYTGVALSADFTLGLGVAPFVDLFADHRPLGGARATLWIHAGIAPYLSVSKVWGLGASGTMDLSLGLRIPFSVIRF